MLTRRADKELAVTSVRESAARTRILVHHIDRMLDYFKYRCDHSSKPEDARRYRIVYYSYLAEEAEQKTFLWMTKLRYFSINSFVLWRRLSLAVCFARSLHDLQLHCSIIP